MSVVASFSVLPTLDKVLPNTAPDIKRDRNAVAAAMQGHRRTATTRVRGGYDPLSEVPGKARPCPGLRGELAGT